MKASQREDHRYTAGFENPIAIEERVLFSMLPTERQRSVLDVGCGVGIISAELEEMGFSVKGIDFSAVAVQKAVEHGIDARVSDIDDEGLKFPDASFDVVWAGDVVEHVFDPIFMLKEAFRVLKPDGVLLLTTPNDFSLHSRLRLFLSGRSIQSAVYRKLGQCKHHTFFSWELLRFMLGQAGFTVDRYLAVVKVPCSRKEFLTSCRLVGRSVGRLFVVRATKAEDDAANRPGA